MDFERQFGVEIEHGNRQYSWQEVGQLVRKKFPRWDNNGHDGSGVEVRSPILKGQSGLDELGEVMEYLKSIGGYVTQADGMHVHHDARDFVPRGLRVRPEYKPGHYDARGVYHDTQVVYPRNKRIDEAADRVLAVLESYTENQALINLLVDPYRRRRQPISKITLSKFKKDKRIETGRYNIHYTGEHGTFEFRQFEGCLDPVKAFAWIEFGQHFLNYCKGLGRPATCATSAVALCRRLNLPASTQHVLLDRPRNTVLPSRFS